MRNISELNLTAPEQREARKMTLERLERDLVPEKVDAETADKSAKKSFVLAGAAFSFGMIFFLASDNALIKTVGALAVLASLVKAAQGAICIDQRNAAQSCIQIIKDKKRFLGSLNKHYFPEGTKIDTLGNPAVQFRGSGVVTDELRHYANIVHENRSR